jgi:hypothetical protein
MLILVELLITTFFVDIGGIVKTNKHYICMDVMVQNDQTKHTMITYDKTLQFSLSDTYIYMYSTVHSNCTCNYYLSPLSLVDIGGIVDHHFLLILVEFLITTFYADIGGIVDHHFKQTLHMHGCYGAK